MCLMWPPLWPSDNVPEGKASLEDAPSCLQLCRSQWSVATWSCSPRWECTKDGLIPAHLRLASTTTTHTVDAVTHTLEYFMSGWRQLQFQCVCACVCVVLFRLLRVYLDQYIIIWYENSYCLEQFIQQFLFNNYLYSTNSQQYLSHDIEHVG